MPDLGILNIPWLVYEALANEFGVGAQQLQHRSGYIVQPLSENRVGFTGAIGFKGWDDEFHKPLRECRVWHRIPKSADPLTNTIVLVRSSTSRQEPTTRVAVSIMNGELCLSEPASLLCARVLALSIELKRLAQRPAAAVPVSP